MKDSIRIIKSTEEYKVIADPFRLKIVNVYIEQDKPLTVKMVADIIGEIPAKVHYHIQKLIKIDILYLDHVEIINGINAKYYLLRHKLFRLAVEDDASPQMKEFQIDSSINTILKSIDLFKGEIIEKGDLIKKHGSDANDNSFFVQRKVYLTKEEQQEFNDYVRAFMREHRLPKKDSDKYTIFTGVLKKIK